MWRMDQRTCLFMIYWIKELRNGRASSLEVYFSVSNFFSLYSILCDYVTKVGYMFSWSWISDMNGLNYYNWLINISNAVYSGIDFRWYDVKKKTSLFAQFASSFNLWKLWFFLSLASSPNFGRTMCTLSNYIMMITIICIKSMHPCPRDWVCFYRTRL